MNSTHSVGARALASAGTTRKKVGPPLRGKIDGTRMSSGTGRGFARTMFVLTALYLFVEVPFAATLVDALSSDVSHDQITRIEQVGRIVSGAAVALALVGWLGPRAIRRGSGPIATTFVMTMVAALAVALTFVAEKALVDGIAENTSGQARYELSKTAIARQHLVRGGSVVGTRLDMSSPTDRAAVAVFSLASYGSDPLHGIEVDRAALATDVVGPTALSRRDFDRRILNPLQRDLETQRKEVLEAQIDVARGGLRGRIVRDTVAKRPARDRAIFKGDATTPKRFSTIPQVRSEILHGLGLPSYDGPIHAYMSDKSRDRLYLAVSKVAAKKAGNAYVKASARDFGGIGELDQAGFEIARASVAPVLALVFSFLGAVVHAGKVVRYAILGFAPRRLSAVAGTTGIVASICVLIAAYVGIGTGGHTTATTPLGVVAHLQGNLYPVASYLGENGPYRTASTYVFGELPRHAGVASPGKVARETVAVVASVIPVPTPRPSV